MPLLKIVVVMMVSSLRVMWRSDLQSVVVVWQASDARGGAWSPKVGIS
jgi:hypothetical protein